MSVQPDPYSEGYATADDVADHFDKFENGFDSSTSPTKSEVERRSRIESDWIDRYTGHAWRPRKVEEEYLTLDSVYYWRAGSPLKLRKRQIITPLDSSKGDKLEVWEGEGGSEGFTDWVAQNEYDEGRDQDYWIEESTGMLYLYRRKIWFERHKEIRVSYRYGWEWPDPANKPADSGLSDEQYKRQNVPQAIREACSLRVAAHYLESQQYRVTAPGNQEAPDASNIAERWREDAKEILEPYKEIRRMGSQ